MEILKQYMDEIKEDLALNDFNLKEKQLRMASRKHYWVARLIDAKVKKNQLLSQKKHLKKELIGRIGKESPIKLSQTTADTVAENTPEIEKLNESIKEQDIIIEYLEKVEKIFSSTHWEIKNIVQINQMEQL